MTTTAPLPTPAPPVRRPWSGWRTLLVIIGAVSVLSGVILFAIAGVGLWAQQQRGADGYFSAGPARVTTGSSAVTVPSVDVNGAGPDAFYTDAFLGDIRISLESSTSGKPLFIGIAPADRVGQYLAGVAHDEISDIDVDPFRPTYTMRSGDQPAAEPASQSFWVASDTGTGPRSLTWNATEGDWAIVIMNADGSPTVDTNVTIAATLPALKALTPATLMAASLLLLAGIAVIVLTATTRKPPAGPPTAADQHPHSREAAP